MAKKSKASKGVKKAKSLKAVKPLAAGKITFNPF